MTIKSFTDKNKKKILNWGFIILAILVLWRYNNPEAVLEVGTQSMFGGASGIGMSIGVLLLILGIALLFIPGGQFVSVLFFGGALILGLGTGIAVIESLFSSIQGVLIMSVALFIAYLYFSK